MPYFCTLKLNELQTGLKALIDQGENQRLDFKYCISSSRKIAKTLAAFANSDGGVLLVGVRDNGSIAGVSSEEEYYMIEAAASLYTRPSIEYTMITHRSDSKSILEVRVMKGKERPYQAKDDDGRWIPYIRSGDKNFIANRIIVNVWKREINRKGILVKLRLPETLLLSYLKENQNITLSRFKRIASISLRQAEKILADFILLGVIKYEVNEDGYRYSQGEEFASQPLNNL